MIPVALLRYADSPRLNGESAEHIRAFAEADAEFPPILVHRATMRVIDGMHRLRAAILSGRREIKVRFFDGADAEAFVAGVRANIAHGLPLSLADREAAAARILTSHPRWSDRAIAEVAGLASTTVARIRGRSAHAQHDVRVGRDGRVRPVNAASGRRLAGQMFAEHPDASLREIAELAGISPATAKDVRDRLKRGEDPVPARLALAESKSEAAARDDPALDLALILQELQRDPALLLNDDGRELLRRLNSRMLNAEELIPAHCVALVADLALGLAEEWTRFAENLKRRATGE